MANQSDIDRRAAELAKWNPSLPASWAIKTARAEAVAGTLPSYTPVAIAQREVDRLERGLITAQNAPRYDAVFIDHINSSLAAATERLNKALAEAAQSQAAE